MAAVEPVGTRLTLTVAVPAVVTSGSGRFVLLVTNIRRTKIGTRKTDQEIISLRNISPLSRSRPGR